MGTIERHKSHQIWQVWTVKTSLSSPFLFSGIVHEWIEGMKKGKREGVKGRNRVCHEKGMMGVSSRTDKNKMMNQKSLHSDGTVEGQEGDSQQQTISNNITSVYYCSDNLSNYLGYFGQLCPSWFNHLRLGFSNVCSNFIFPQDFSLLLGHVTKISETHLLMSQSCWFFYY